MKTDKKNLITIAIAVTVGLFIGWIRFGTSTKKEETEPSSTIAAEHHHEGEETIWTCSMHPQIRQSEPGDCPICGMDLIPLEKEESSDDPREIRMSPAAMKLAEVRTQTAKKMKPVKEIRLNGKVALDERQVFSQVSHLGGRIEALKVSFTGQYVTKGTTLAYLYSPELVSAQEELLEAERRKEEQPGLYRAAREKLKNRKLTDEQINDIIAAGTPQQQFPILADASGYVTQKLVNQGDYVKAGQPIYTIANLSTLWVMFEVYEKDITWLKPGDKVVFTTASHPGKTFHGTISYIDPLIDAQTRVTRARVELPNPELALKPGMFVTGVAEALLPDREERIVVPKSAVMWTGKRSVVYVKKTDDDFVRFAMREVVLGPDLGSSYIVEEGLMPGEEIAVNGTFSIDAAAQLAGKHSMMNPRGGKADSGPDHGNMASDQMANRNRNHQKEDINLDDNYKTPQQFKKQLTDFFNQYIKMKDAMVASDASKTASEARETLKALEKTDMSLLEGEAHIFWIQNLDTMKKALQVISQSKEIDIQREAFVDFNPILYRKIKALGLDGETVYYQFCPMANDDQGAFWLSNEENIRNPYFGDMMLECGEVKDKLDF
ncbi:efflux RND transporter periplasmic adaptor subunit [Thermophagus sp. OGC60D27]|uniref:efflux RND transporter periplasmic adaptor subunit n=1 Tax=Thermophagus sp. OGC60D27 TaxID=3458415 RepID=UPI0040377B72